MKDFKQNRGKRFGGGYGGRPNFPRKSWGGSGSRDRGPVTMHQAVCDQCGKSCEVPFKPTSGKPVYCNVCFGGKKEIRNSRGGDRFPLKTDNDEMKKQFDMLNAKLDRIIKSLTPVVPVKEEKKEVIVKKKEKVKKTKKK